jgi:serine/threonine protein kinase
MGVVLLSLSAAAKDVEVYFDVYPKHALVLISANQYPAHQWKRVTLPGNAVDIRITAEGWAPYSNTVDAGEFQGRWPSQPLQLEPISLSARLSLVPPWVALFGLLPLAWWRPRPPSASAPTAVSENTRVIAGEARIGGYLVHEKLGEGASGVVYRVTDSAGEEHALKLLKVHDGEQLKRFQREMNVLRQLRHPNLPYLVDHGTHSGSPFLVMELLGQKHLGQMLPLPIGQAKAVMLQLLSVLQVCHREGVLHRDIKPANVIWGEKGRVRLTDFGLARYSESSTLTQEGTIMGTPHYMAPEIIQGEPATAAADQYSLGCLFYEMLSGRPPFDADNPMAVLMQHLQESPRPLPNQSPEINEILQRMLAKKAGERYLNLAVAISRLEKIAE